ncbi:MAG: ABC transporter permease [Candidatus Methanoperedens sp.]|nr:ABC transporter permease [Candidatus Methanoperedens sp.]MCE8427301.1 ABC transporter permease [Candidatus Methanoperedens sp.]
MTFTTNIWNYRHLTYKLAISDFKLRYKNSVLGFFWSLLEPLLMLVVLYIVFTNLMRVNVEHYQLFLLMGIISWNLLSRGTTMSLYSILGKPSLVKKVYFPREVLVISSCITALLMTLLEFVVFGIFMLVFAVVPGRLIVYFPAVLFVEFLLVLGLSFGIAALNVYYRDVQYIWAVILQAGFFAAPIIYPLSIIPEKYLWIIMLNPMTRIIDMLRGSVIYSTAPIPGDGIFIIAATLLVFVIGYLIFLRLEPGFAEEM